MTKLAHKIPNRLRSLGDNTFLIVAGRQDAVFYSASDGEIRRLDAFKVPRPHYSDREGEFKTRSRRAGVVRSGGVREYGDENIIRDFLKEFRERFKAFRGRFERIFLFAPPEMQRKIAAVVPESERRKIEGAYDGNFYYRHPLSLLERIEEAKPERFAPLSDDEAKILRVPRQR